MVGVNGAAVSNLNPPTLAAVTFGIAQAGLALLLREPLARWMRQPLAWAAVATANLSAMTLYLWHQTAISRDHGGPGRRPDAGSPDRPDRRPVDRQRLAWLPVFAAVLGACGWSPPGRAGARSGGAGRGGKMAGRERGSPRGMEA